MKKLSKFIHLSKPPIVEAALDIRISPNVEFKDEKIFCKLKDKLVNYPKYKKLKLSSLEIKFNKDFEQNYKDLGVIGYKFFTKNNTYIVQFNENGFVFSRLIPYESWGKFKKEAFRLWNIYYKFFKPPKIERVGLRYINRIIVESSKVELNDYYVNPPSFLSDISNKYFKLENSVKEKYNKQEWKFVNFLNKETMKVPNQPYMVNLVKTNQFAKKGIGLILDIDVFFNDGFDYDLKKLKILTDEMRNIKNKVFFSSIKEEIIKGMK